MKMPSSDGKKYRSATKKREKKDILTGKDVMSLKVETEILDYLRKKSKPVSFYELYTDLDYTSGKAQSALHRLARDGLVVLRRKVEKFKTMVWDKPFSLETDALDVEDEDAIVFPVRVNKVVGAVFQEVPQISEDRKTFADLIRDAMVYYFQEKIPQELKEKAIHNAVEKGIISKALGDKILGKEIES